MTHVNLPDKKYVMNYDINEVCDKCNKKLDQLFIYDNLTLKCLICTEPDGKCIKYFKNFLEAKSKFIKETEDTVEKERQLVKRKIDVEDNTFRQNEEIINLLRGLSLAISGNIDTTNERLSKIENVFK